MMTARLAFLACALLAALPATAHPGHGASAEGWLHYLSEPRHFLALMGAIVFCAAVALAAGRGRASAQARGGR